MTSDNLDSNEQDILDSVENDEWQSKGNIQQRLFELQQIGARGHQIRLRAHKKAPRSHAPRGNACKGRSCVPKRWSVSL